MTWLLHKLQKILGSLTGQRSSSQSSESTQLGSEIASRLKSSNAADSADPVAVRVQGNSLAPVSPPQSVSQPQSTVPLRQKKSSVLKDTVDPVAAEPDTHQRLDAASAALPGGTLAAPSFPTDVSELISSQSSQPPALKDSLHDSLPVPDVTSSADSEQLPDIHDLLPAIEPEQPSDTSAFESLSAPDEEMLLAESVSNVDDVLIADDISASAEVSSSNLPTIESAQRVSVSEQATLFSFDIVETDTAVEGDWAESSSVGAEGSSVGAESSEFGNESAERGLVEAADAEVNLLEPPVTSTNASIEAAVDCSEQAPASEPPAVELPVVEALIPDTLLNDLSVRKIDEPAVIDAVDAATVDVEERSDAESVFKASPASDQNPWLTAVPAQRKESVEETLTKNGRVKLLFKLKAGNFHGYIAPDDGSKDILFHQKYINADIFEHIDRGTQVVVTAKYMEGKAYATRVELLQNE